MCMNLQADLVRVLSCFAWTLTKKGPEDQTKAKIVNCRWTDSFGELLVYSYMFCSHQYHDHVTIIIFEPT